MSNTIKEYLLNRKRKLNYFLDEFRSGTFRNNIALHYSARQPQVEELVLRHFTADEKDEHHAERLITAYHKAMADYQKPEHDIWAIIFERQADFFRLLDEKNPKHLAQYLCNMFKEDATIGTAQGKYEYERMRMVRSYRNYIARHHKDKLVALAEAFGVLPIENPEQGSYGRNIFEDSKTLMDKISAFVGQDITPPDIDGGFYKLKAGNALISERDCTAIYTGHMIRDAKKICEIGAGIGRTCYWGSRFGDMEYTIVDLPHINVVHGFYLLKSMGEAVSLYGETPKKIRILPCHKFPDEKFDLVLNQDSFPEIAENIVIDYLNWIKAHATEFLSINFESMAPYPGGRHLNVYELTQKVGGLERTARSLFWMRKGYVVERYKGN